MERIDTEIVRAKPWHAEAIAEKVRPEDAEEIWAATLHSPVDAMLQGMEYSDIALTGMAGGAPVAMWGIVSDSMIFDEGTPWMVASSMLDKPPVTRQFLRQCRDQLVAIMSNYDTLENYVDARNKRSIRWLKFMGFTIEDPEPYGALNMPFHRFWMKKEKDNV